MRISDWSSDVCSSDLVLRPLGVVRGGRGVEERQEARPVAGDDLREHLFARLRPRFGHAVEPCEHCEAEPRVEAAALGIAAAVLAHQPGGFLMPPDRAIAQIGRETWRESVCKYVRISVFAVSYKK